VDVHRDVDLQDMPDSTVEHDISAFLQYEFEQKRNEYNSSRSKDSLLLLNWTSERNIEILAKMATPSFIFAATVCRFVFDDRFEPEEQLAMVLRYEVASQASKLDGTYLPILDRLLVGLSKAESENLTQDFREIVGSIIILADPLSTSSVARLLKRSKRAVDRRLELLHSVLSIPSDDDSSVRSLHLSFREFLLDPEKQGENPFWVDERKTHEMLATRCLDLMSGPDCLYENICHLESPGTLREGINHQTIDKYLLPHVRYACRYWVHHLKQSKSSINDQGEVYRFLQKHFLHWLEALSLIGVMSESFALVGTLQSLIAVSPFIKRTYAHIYTNRISLCTCDDDIEDCFRHPFHRTPT
jgi:hypothetical protein